jgi:hypothetical protein
MTLPKPNSPDEESFQLWWNKRWMELTMLNPALIAQRAWVEAKRQEREAQSKTEAP